MIPIHNHSHYSALDGYGTPDEIGDRLLELDMSGAFITDHGNVAGWNEWQRMGDKKGLFTGYGAELYQARTHRSARPEQKNTRDGAHLILLAQTPKGYHNIRHLADEANRSGFYYSPRVDWELLEKYKEGVIATSACIAGLVSQGIKEGTNEYLDKFLNIFRDKFYLEIHTYDSEEQQQINLELWSIAQKRGIPVVIANDAHYCRKEDWELHETLMAVQFNKPVDLDNPLHPPCLYIQSERDVRLSLDYLSHVAVDQAIRNTEVVAELCTFDPGRPGRHLPRFPSRVDNNLLLIDEVEDGLRERYGEFSPEVQERTEFELEAIIDAGLADYFLIVADIVSWSHKHGIMTGCGRGSSAGSILAYALGITTIDPLKHKLYFERFWNPGRTDGLPDIDVDIETKRREDVKEYLAQKYGRDRVLSIGAYSTMGPKAAIRRVMKALHGADTNYIDIDAISKILQTTTDAGLTADWEAIHTQAGEELDPYVQKYPDVFRIAEKFTDRITHFTTHASGVVVSDVDLPEELPSRQDRKQNLLVTQVDMREVEKCLSEDTEILTENGWKLGLGVEVGDRVAAWDPLENMVSLLPVQEKFTYDYRGELHLFSNAVTDQLVTPNHWVYYKTSQKPHLADEGEWRCNQAKDVIRSRLVMPCASYHEGEGIGGDDYAALLGWVFTEGHFEQDCCSIRIAQSSVNQPYVDEIHELLSALEAKFSHYEYQATYCDHCGSQSIAHSWIFAGDLAQRVRVDLPQRTPTWSLLWRMTQSEKVAFRTASLKGDGSCDRTFYQKDKDDRIWFQALNALTGRTSTLSDDASYSVGSRNRATTEFAYLSKAMREDTVDYDGRVWCVSVQTGAFMARRNGKVFLTGNSGFVKIDLLGLRNLDTLKKTIELAGVPNFDFSAVPYFSLADSYWQQIEKGYTLGFFQIEDGDSAKRIGKEVKCRSIDDLAAIIALNRPGPLRTGATERFIKCRAGQEPRYQHPLLESILEPTYGEMIYQEQVLEYFRAIGYSLSEADEIRKILGKKLVEEMEKEKPRYLERASQFMDEFLAEEILHGIEEFAKYSFNKSHAVGYGTILAWTMYAKWKWPTEFILASILTVDDAERVARFVSEGRRLGITISPPDVNYSEVGVGKYGDKIYFGLSNIKGIGKPAAKWIIDHRPYLSYEDFMEAYEEAQVVWEEDKRGKSPRQTIRANQIEAVYNAGGFDGLGERELTLEEKATMEEELLGVALTDVVGEIVERNKSQFDGLSSFKDLEEETNDSIPVPGIVTTIRKSRVRADARRNAGEEFAWVSIEWEGDSATFAAFPEEYKRFKFMLRPRVVGRFDLKVSKRGPVMTKGMRFV